MFWVIWLACSASCALGFILGSMLTPRTYVYDSPTPAPKPTLSIVRSPGTPSEISQN